MEGTGEEDPLDAFMAKIDKQLAEQQQQMDDDFVAERDSQHQSEHLSSPSVYTTVYNTPFQGDTHYIL